MAFPVAHHEKRSRHGFTAIEILVSIAVVGVMFGISLPAIQHVREVARKTQCSSHLHQLGIAVGAYHASHAMYPAGCSNRATWLQTILPHVGERELLVHIQSQMAASTAASFDAPALYHCPSDNRARPHDTNYAGNFGAITQRDGANGLFRHAPSMARWHSPLQFEGYIRAQHITDGMSNTALASESLCVGLFDHSRTERVDWVTPRKLNSRTEWEQFIHLCLTMPKGNAGIHTSAGESWWVNGMFATLYTHHLPPNSPRCSNGADMKVGAYPPSSLHAGGVNLVLADVSVRFVSDKTDRTVFQAAGSRDGSETSNLW